MGEVRFSVERGEIVPDYGHPRWATTLDPILVGTDVRTPDGWVGFVADVGHEEIRVAPYGEDVVHRVDVLVRVAGVRIPTPAPQISGAYQLECGHRGEDWTGFPGPGPIVGVIVACGSCRTQRAVTWVSCSAGGHLPCPSCRPAIQEAALVTGRSFVEVLELVQRAEDLTLQKLTALSASSPPSRAERRRIERKTKGNR